MKSTREGMEFGVADSPRPLLTDRKRRDSDSDAIVSVEVSNRRSSCGRRSLGLPLFFLLNGRPVQAWAPVLGEVLESRALDEGGVELRRLDARNQASRR